MNLLQIFLKIMCKANIRLIKEFIEIKTMVNIADFDNVQQNKLKDVKKFFNH